MNSNFYSTLSSAPTNDNAPTDWPPLCHLPPATCPFPSQCLPIFSVIHFRQTPFCVNKTHTHNHTHANKHTHTHWCVRCSKAAALFMLPTAVTTFWTKNETPSPVAWAGLSRCVHLSLTLPLWACLRVCVCVLVTC